MFEEAETREEMRPLIYVSGPISHGGTLSPEAQKANVRHATSIAFSLIRSGFSVYCPHWSLLAEDLIEMTLDHGMWIENDLPLVGRCDALLRLPGPSKGADMEVEHAYLCEVPVFTQIGFLKDHFAL